MPVVPNFAVPGVLPSGGIQPVSPQAGLQGDEALQGAGAKMQAGGDKVVQAQMQLDQMNSQSQALHNTGDAVNQSNDTVTNFQLMQGKNAVDSYPSVVQKLIEIRQQNGAGLNPYAKNIYEQSTDYMLREQLNQVHQHFAQQTRSFHLETLNGVSTLATAQASQYYNDPGKVETGYQTVVDAANQQADVAGLQGPARQALVLKYTSSYWLTVVGHANATDPLYAGHLLNQAYSKGQLTGPAYVQLLHQQRSSVLPFAANNIANSVLGTGESQPSDGVFAKMVQVESAGNQFGPDGKPLISSAGAVGIAQVEPATGEATAKANGIPWDPARFESDHAYNRHLGHLYFNSLQAQFPGNTAAAVASYNAGPGAVTAAMAQAKKNGTSNWLQFMRTETQNYVPKVLGAGATGAQPGAGMSPPEMMQNVQLLESEASKRAEMQFPDQPEAGQMAADRVFQVVMRKNEAYEHAQRATVMNLADVVNTNKIDNIADLNKLGPSYAAQYNALGAQGQLSIQAMMKHNTPGYNVQWTPKAQQTYNSVVGLSISDPRAFLSLNPTDPALVSALPHAMISSISEKQAAIKRGITNGVPPARVHSLLETQIPTLVSAGINLRASPATAKQAYLKSQQFTGAFSQDVDAFYQQHDRLPNTQEAQAITNRLLVRGAIDGSGNFLTGPDEMSLYRAEAAGDVPKFEPKVPPPVNAAINAAYIKQFGHPPDKQTVAQLYLESLAPSHQQTEGTDAILRTLGTKPLVPLPPHRAPPGIVAPPPNNALASNAVP